MTSKTFVTKGEHVNIRRVHINMGNTTRTTIDIHNFSLCLSTYRSHTFDPLLSFCPVTCNHALGKSEFSNAL